MNIFSQSSFLPRVRMQTSTTSLSMGETMRLTYQEGGVTGFYRGIQSPLSGLLIMNGLLFFGYGTARRFLGDKPGAPLIVSQLATAGAMAGVTVTLAECPVDFLKTQLQMNSAQYKGFVDCARTIVQSRGPLGIFQGFAATMMRNIPGNFLWYGGFELTRELMLQDGQSRSDLGIMKTALAGAVGGVVYWTTFPIDAIKSTVQSDHFDPAKRKYKGTLDAARQMYKRAGTKAFTRGFTPAILRTIPASAATFVVYDIVLRKLTGEADVDDLGVKIVV